MKYLVSHQGQESGPFELAEIVAKVRAKEIDLFDYIYDQAKQDWVLLMEHAELAVQLKSNKPPRPVAAKEAAPTAATVAPAVVSAVSDKDAHAISEWFILKGENKFGPFSFTDVVKMLQQKIVFPFDFVWHAGLKNWCRVAEVGDFSEESIRQLYGARKNQQHLFAQRQHPRKKFEGKVLIHDNLTLWRGQGFEISKGGVGVTMKNSLIVPGQQVFVHFKGEGPFPAFNAVCEVVSKKFVNDAAPVQYGMKFLSLTQEAQDEFYKKVN